MIPAKPAPQSSFEFALSQLTPEVRPHVLRTMHGLISAVLTATLTDGSADRDEQAAEARAMAKFLRMLDGALGGGAFSSVQPKQEIRYVTPSQLPGAAATTTAGKKTTRKATPRGKPTP